MSLSNNARVEKALMTVPLLSKSWGIALTFCREKRGFSKRDVAENINVSEADVALWEQDKGVPTGVKLVRLHGMMPQLRHFKNLIDRTAQKTAEMQEVAEQRRAKARPPEPEPTPPMPKAPSPTPPPPPQYQSFAEALWSIRLRSRLSAAEVAKAADIAYASVYRIEKGVEAISPTTYRGLLAALPELRNAPPPTVRSGRGETYDGSIILEEFTRPAQRSAPPESSGQISEEKKPLPEPAAPLPEAATLANNLASTYSALAAAQKRAAETMEVAMKADEELRAAQAAVAEAESKLRSAMGLKQ